MNAKLNELHNKGTEAYEAGDYEKAGRLFEEFLTINPRFADIQNKMGVILHQTNRPKLAVRAFIKALDLNPGYTEASLNLAITYSDLGQYDKAREVFERAAQFKTAAPEAKSAFSDLDPFIKGKLADEHLRIGNMYSELNLLEPAIDEYRKALLLSPNFADIITRLGIALRDKGQVDEAIKEFNRAKVCNPRYIPARIHLGVTYYSQGFYGMAEKEWQEALTIDPGNTAVTTYLNFVKPQEA